jgi:hypothetical protein
MVLAHIAVKLSLITVDCRFDCVEIGGMLEWGNMSIGEVKPEYRAVQSSRRSLNMKIYY